MTVEFGPVAVSTEQHIAVVSMGDKASGNTISPELDRGLREALEYAATDDTAHVVVVTGLADRFSCGASREYLASARRRSVEPFVRAFVHCPLPVVAAVSGHAIGGGLVQGLYADVPILSERSVYAANFLNFGLAPEYGTTWVLSNRLGATLAAEMLFTARGYRGSELRERGATVRVVPHDQVFSLAIAEAKRIAEKPRHASRMLKRQLTEQVLTASDAAIAREVGPHEQTWEHPSRTTLVADHYGRAEKM